MKNSDMPAMPFEHKEGARFAEFNRPIGAFSSEDTAVYRGLTKREHMAGLAMQGLLSNTGTASSLDKAKDKGQCLLDLVDVSVFVADTLLARLDSVGA